MAKKNKIVQRSNLPFNIGRPTCNFSSKSSNQLKIEAPRRKKYFYDTLHK